jgi:hypothetical protein
MQVTGENLTQATSTTSSSTWTNALELNLDIHNETQVNLLRLKELYILLICLPITSYL